MYSFILVYISIVYYSLLSILGLEKFSYISKIFYAVITMIGIWKIFINILKDKLTYNKIFVMIYALLYIPLYYMTSLLYNYENSLYKYRFTYIISLCVIPLIIGYIDGSKDKIEKMAKYIPLFSIIFTVGSFLATVYSSGSSQWGGYVNDESGFNYQNASYCAAYSFGLIMFYILNYKNINKMKVFDKIWVRNLLIGMAIINWMTILLSGGKGGFVTGIIYGLYALYQFNQKNRLNFGTIIKMVISSIALTCIGFLVVLSVENSSLSVSGFERIVDFIKTGNDTGRSTQYILAIQSIKESPIIGHGIGSVYYEVQPYTHNFFLDVLVETGVVGLIYWITCFFILFRKMYILTKINNINNMIVVIFLSGFIMSMFSGYYLSHVSIMWTIGYIFSIRLDKEIVENRYKTIPSYN